MFGYFVISVNICRARLRPGQRREEDAAVLGVKEDPAGSAEEEEETSVKARRSFFVDLDLYHHFFLISIFLCS